MIKIGDRVRLLDHNDFIFSWPEDAFSWPEDANVPKVGSEHVVDWVSDSGEVVSLKGSIYRYGTESLEVIDGD